MAHENTTTDVRADGPGFWQRLLVKRARGADEPPGVEAPAPGAPPTVEAEEPPPPPAWEAGASPGPDAVEAPFSPAPPPREAAEAPASIPAPPLGGAYPTRAIVTIAAVPSLASLIWTAWSVADMLPAPTPVALAVGVVLDIALVAAVAIAWIAPAVSGIARIASWGIAGFAALAVGVHGMASDTPVMALFAAVPLISKLLWHLALSSRLEEARREAHRLHMEAVAAEEAQRREAEEEARAAELSADLSHDQRREIARLRQQAAYAKERAEAELDLEAARAEADHQKALADLERSAAQQMAADEQDAEIYKRRLRLAREIRAGQGVASLAFDAAPAVPDDLSALPQGMEAPAAPGGGRSVGFGFTRPLDVDALTPEGASVRFEELAPTHQALVQYVHTSKPAASVRGAARQLERDPRTIRRWRDELKGMGYELSIGK